MFMVKKSVGEQDEARDANGYDNSDCGIFQKAFWIASAGMIQERNSKQDEKVPERWGQKTAGSFAARRFRLAPCLDIGSIDPAGEQFGDSIKRQQGGKIQDGAKYSMQSFSTHPFSKADPLCIMGRKINRKYNSYAVDKNRIEIGTCKT